MTCTHEKGETKMAGSPAAVPTHQQGSWNGQNNCHNWNCWNSWNNQIIHIIPINYIMDTFPSQHWRHSSHSRVDNLCEGSPCSKALLQGTFRKLFNLPSTSWVGGRTPHELLQTGVNNTKHPHQQGNRSHVYTACQCVEAQEPAADLLVPL